MIDDVLLEEPYAYQELDDKFVVKAKKELRENPDQVRAHISSLRRWLRSMPHISAPDDDRFLLKFLRNAKYDHSLAQQALDNFCTVRSSSKGSPEWYPKIDVNGNMIQTFLDSGIMTPMGRNDEGELLIICRFGRWEIDKVTLNELIATIYATMDLILSDEMTQICGIQVMQDMRQADKAMHQFNSPKLMFKLIRNWQDAMPMRTKADIQWHEPVLYHAVMALARPFMKPWLKKRFRPCGTSQTKLFKALGGTDTAMRILPTEYGGWAGSIDDASQRFRDRMTAAQPLFDRLATIRVDESKRLPGTKNYLAQFDTAIDMDHGAKGTYTKLDVY